MSVKSFFLKVVSPILVAGDLVESGEIIEVLEHEAKSLLSRGKALLATDDDIADTDSGVSQDSDEATTGTGPAGAPASDPQLDSAEAKDKE